MAKGSLESAQQKPIASSNDLSHLPDDDELGELVWENGQIMIQGQSSKTRKNTNSNNFQSPNPMFRDRSLENTSNPKTGRYGLMGSSTMHDFTSTVPSSNLEDDDMAPWLNYGDPLHNNYCPDFLPEVSSVTAADFPHQNHPQPSSCGFSNTSSGIINFSHFSRPVVLARADTRNVNTVHPASSSGLDKTSLAEKGNFVPTSNEMGSNTQAVNSRNSESQGNVSREDDAVRNNAPPHQVDVAVSSKGIREGDKNVEPVVASSSVGSGYNPEQTSDDQNHNLKRKSPETDDSEGRSEDVEEESVGIRKAASARGGTGTKRSRAAEVHNLSERRRRDRINEKMRALQELIPNCNKVDKASMLDEAIEYLKTLQLQVQMLSMGAGLYMPHMMLPTGMQHVPAHYPPMMGLGMGYGMGILDMNGGPRFHIPRPMSFSGPTNFPMMAGAGPNIPGFGPGGPAFPVSLPPQPSFPSKNDKAADHATDVLPS